MKYRNEFHEKCSTKAKRAVIMADLKALAEECGAVLTNGKHLIDWYMISKGPYKVSFDLDGDWRVGAFLGHWHTEGGARYPHYFGVTIRGTVNTHHYAKATTCETTYEGFKRSLRAGLGDLTASG